MDGTRRGRPKRLREPVKLNLLIEATNKRAAYELACERGLSMSQLFEHLVREARKGAA